MSTSPFFIVGAPRSGTTLLRDILRTVPHLGCPEETHFYRWSSPFKSALYTNRYAKGILPKHRAIDGVTDDEFWAMYERSHDRRELQEAYMSLFAERRIGSASDRWFDKTPQNAYGLAMLHHDYPKAKIVHIARDPVAVVSSLMRGAVLQASSIDEAVAHWIEPTRNVIALQRTRPDLVINLTHRDLVHHYESTMAALCQRLEIDPLRLQFDPAELNDGFQANRDIDGATAAHINTVCAVEMAAVGLAP